MLEFVLDATGLVLLAEQAGAMDRLVIDFAPLAPRIVALMEEANREMRLQQQDRYGRTMPDVEWYAGRPGPGPALVPRGEGSRAITEYRCVVVYLGPNLLRIQAGWTESARFLQYHVDAWKGRPERDILGLPMWVEERLDALIDPFIDERVLEYVQGLFPG